MFYKDGLTEGDLLMYSEILLNLFDSIFYIQMDMTYS